MRLYLAGPMSGYPELNHPMFDRVAAALRAHGHEVFSPAEMDRSIGINARAENPFQGLRMTGPEIMRQDLLQVLQSEGIALLPGWQDSSGARLERVVAQSTGRAIYIVIGIPHQIRLFVAPPWHHELIWTLKCPSASS